VTLSPQLLAILRGYQKLTRPTTFLLRDGMKSARPKRHRLRRAPPCGRSGSAGVAMISRSVEFSIQGNAPSENARF